MSELPLTNIERQEQLLRLVEERRRVRVSDIVEQFAVSLATARRDLDSLADQGKVQRFHGGAIAAHQAPPEPPALKRASEQKEAKQHIAESVVQIIQEGDSIYLGSGTTAFEIARRLRAYHNLTVVTNSLLVINTLADAPGITLVGLGGLFRPSELSFIGHLTEKSLAEVRTNKVILGIRAIDVEQGLTNEDLEETMTDRAILKVGREVIVVADHTKLGRVSAAFVAPITAIHTLVTDVGASHDDVQALTAKGLNVILAGQVAQSKAVESDESTE